MSDQHNTDPQRDLQPINVPADIKGPEDKPLIVKDTVQAWVK